MREGSQESALDHRASGPSAPLETKARLLRDLGADGAALAPGHRRVEEALLGLGEAQRREHRGSLDRGVGPGARDERLGGHLAQEGEDAGGGLKLRCRRLVA